ncbi:MULTISPECIES: hypothetical protein [unclassified Isoptericola]|uniref:hypothetical protein n=1 Tax=unclassified Isoptericola TaxID=2623355 RepID=UPI00271346CB|nr:MULTISPECIES: hypothetical protein [unclassified Isoptericola]MDO8143446.1 hypothetical protein [Isoptericola sp. 178]MDO8150378.1 hypothetical protein [Isoptericola sp. b408]
MARTTRLSPEGEQAVKRIATSEGISENAAIDRALIEYDTKRATLRDQLIAKIVKEDSGLLDRLAK